MRLSMAVACDRDVAIATCRKREVVVEMAKELQIKRIIIVRKRRYRYARRSFEYLSVCFPRYCESSLTIR